MSRLLSNTTQDNFSPWYATCLLWSLSASPALKTRSSWVWKTMKAKEGTIKKNQVIVNVILSNYST